MDDSKFMSLLRKHLKYLRQDQALRAEDDLKLLGLDSLAAIDLLLDVEDQYGVTLPDKYLTDNTFSSAGALRSVILRLVQDGAQAAG
jgi:acyl carrier protein